MEGLLYSFKHIFLISSMWVKSSTSFKSVTSMDIWPSIYTIWISWSKSSVSSKRTPSMYIWSSISKWWTTWTDIVETFTMFKRWESGVQWISWRESRVESTMICMWYSSESNYNHYTEDSFYYCLHDIIVKK